MGGKFVSSLIFFVLCVFVTSSPVPPENYSYEDSSSQGSIENDVRKLSDEVDPVADASSDYHDSDVYPDGNENYRQYRSRQIAPTTSRNTAEVEIDHSIEIEGKSQTFFPSFTNLFQPRQPLGHSRPIASGNQEGAYSQRPNSFRNFLNYQAPSYGANSAFRSNDYGKSIASGGSDANALLGSGNFGVIRGGTFLTDSSDTESDFSDDFDSPYYNGNNGHGRPSFYFGHGNPRPNYNQDQFANFRDFADINSPSNSAYSHYVVVYANKNGTTVHNETAGESNSPAEQSHLAVAPKNIIERLAQIEEEPVKKNKVSKGKLKLSLMTDKKHKNKIVKKMLNNDAKDMVDPLLALS